MKKARQLFFLSLFEDGLTSSLPVVLVFEMGAKGLLWCLSSLRHQTRNSLFSSLLSRFLPLPSPLLRTDFPLRFPSAPSHDSPAPPDDRPLFHGSSRRPLNFVPPFSFLPTIINSQRPPQQPLCCDVDVVY